MNRLPFPATWRTGLAGLSAMLLCAGASAGTVSGPSAPPAALALHQQQLAACAKSPAGDRAACDKRADAALAESLRAQTERRENAGALAANALERCQAHTSSVEREACERIARGEGSANGSVEGGGVIKELTTRTVGPVPDAAPPTSPSAASAAASSTASR